MNGSSVYFSFDSNQLIDHSSYTEWVCIFFKILCTWFLNRVNPILLAYGCPFTKDSARLVTNSISTLGGIGGSKGSTDASIITGFLLSLSVFMACSMMDLISSGSLIAYPIP